jgi:lipoprotein signal peptidase
MVKSRENLVGAYAFLIGVVLAIGLGLFNDALEQTSGVFYTALILIGLIVGFMVSEKNSNTFLLASLALVIVGALGNDPLIYIAGNNFFITALRNVLVSLLVLFIPATIIVAIKTVFAMAKI